jgi:hypothetical protein
VAISGLRAFSGRSTTSPSTAITPPTPARADAETLAFLSYLAHRIRDERVLVVVSHRREDRHVLETWRAGLSERRAIRTVRLDRFEAVQTRSLVAEIFGGDEGELTRFADFVHGESEGNPFYALEYLRWLRDTDALVLAPDRRVTAAGWQRIAEVAIPESIRFGFEWSAHRPETDLDLCLPGDIDRLNFRELAAGTAIGRCRGAHAPVRASDPAGRDVTGTFFECSGHELRLRRAVMPSLLTPDPRIIRQDCLCHLMERIPATRYAAPEPVREN